MNRSRRFGILSVLLGVSSVLVAWFFIYLYAGQTTIPPGVTILDWDASGSTPGEFRQQLSQRVEELVHYDVELRVNAGANITTPSFVPLHKLGLEVSVDKVLQNIESLQDGPVLQRAIRRWQLRHTTLNVSVAFNNEKLEALVLQQWQGLQLSQPVQAKRIITSDDRVTYHAEKAAYRIDLVRLREELVSVVTAILNKRIGENIGDSSQDVRPFIQVPLRVLHPEVTVESLTEEGIERKIAEFTTFYRTSGAGRVHNIQVTAATIHDRIMMPGEVFDYNEVVRETETKFGFKQAPVIVNGKLVPGIGGGICQVSTTLYNAVLRSGLDIVERKNHSLPIRYVPLGQDATFASGHINFKFRNHLDSHLLIRIETTKSQITVKLFGSLPDGISYDINSQIVEVISPPAKYVQNPQLAPGKTQVISQGKSGYIVDTFRMTKQHNKVIKTERISRDHYKAQPALIAANPHNIPKQSPQHTPAPKQHIIEDGVSGPVFEALHY